MSMPEVCMPTTDHVSTTADEPEPAPMPVEPESDPEVAAVRAILRLLSHVRNPADLDYVVRAAKDRERALGRARLHAAVVAGELRVGAPVEFSVKTETGKSRVKGTICKINPTSLRVATLQGTEFVCPPADVTLLGQ